MAVPARKPGLRVVLYSHDSVGLGHTRRNLAIAHALSRELPAGTGHRVSGLLITGERSATSYPCPPGWDWVVMPGISKEPDGYSPRTLDVGMTRLMGVRSSVIDGVLQSFRPHLMVVDRHAFGVDGELTGPLERLKRSRPSCRIVLGLRDVLDAPEVAQREWKGIGADRVGAVFDELWVYGDPSVHDPLETGELPLELADRVRYTGYLADGRDTARAPQPGPDAHPAAPYVLTMAGGGADGFALTAQAARAPVPAGHWHLIVTGPQMPDSQRAEVRALAGGAADVLTSVPDGLACLRGAAAAVVMGGYNTVCEALSTATPTLVVPREAPRTEQLIRATSLLARDAVDLMRQRDATPAGLGVWLRTAVGHGAHADRTRTGRRSLDTGGLARVVEHARRLTTTDTLEELDHVIA
ncbi:glycosyltransferase family protein [Zhihengliuella salsuginis]|uniref:Glycosyl transferase n=1 Tax=Zhihengliuella salsuginis TaxID=578222 RepID=A0ABQ3GL03_9MICC|nr:glycosyl transferase family 28 [Zhihengliuella salsuginis]GHD10092.1 glycosyl transferase [Zhihengliuella salsuginis]